VRFGIVRFMQGLLGYDRTYTLAAWLNDKFFDLRYGVDTSGIIPAAKLSLPGEVRADAFRLLSRRRHPAGCCGRTLSTASALPSEAAWRSSSVRSVRRKCILVLDNPRVQFPGGGDFLS
jgi:hypothetical protein